VEKAGKARNGAQKKSTTAEQSSCVLQADNCITQPAARLLEYIATHSVAQDHLSRKQNGCCSYEEIT
jgi:hypothetical protein